MRRYATFAILIGSAIAHPMTTRQIEPEPSTCLQVEYLMALVDGEDRPAVDALIRATAASSGRVLTAVPGMDVPKASGVAC